MNDKQKYAKIRTSIIDALKVDLIGPETEDEILDESPAFAYLMGILYPRDAESLENDNLLEQKYDDNEYEEFDEPSTIDEDDDNQVIASNLKKQSSIGLSFYIVDKPTKLKINCSWAIYNKFKEEYVDKDGDQRDRYKYQRVPQNEELILDLTNNKNSDDIPLMIDQNIKIHYSKISLKGGYSLVSVYLYNNKKKSNCELNDIIFQVKFSVSEKNNKDVFIPEHKCRERLAPDEFYYEQRPVFARGRGCAAEWENEGINAANLINTTFIPEYEMPGVSADLNCFEKNIFSTSAMINPTKKDEINNRLMNLYNEYEKWIIANLEDSPKMKDEKFKNNEGKRVITNCRKSLTRIKNGIDIIYTDDQARDAFCFMNRVMFLQNAIKNYAKKHGQYDNNGKQIECAFSDFSNPRIETNRFAWRPFQLAFILMNLESVVNPQSSDREIVDLLYFPTGGGKTEAYLGLIAFTISLRRLRKTVGEFNCDGGVSVILRYTLRLLTTQQRDRLTKMIVAAEFERKNEEIKNPIAPKYGKERFSIGFWVGGGVTPNKFEDIKEDVSNNGKKNALYNQILTCPFCGTKLDPANYFIDYENKNINIFCHDKDCMFYKYKENRQSIPVYLVDEEIYAKCPTIILSTVDKFATLPWKVEVNNLFGRVSAKSDKGFSPIGKKPEARSVEIKQFLPPELIIQDELHLITGPLGTIYGAYETMVDRLCTYKINGQDIKPKYIVSTATIKNANEQTKCLYGRKDLSKFPSNGFDIRDSFFIKEMSLDENPFRQYVGISAFGQSMKTTALRIYAVLLQKTFELSQDDDAKKWIDPYYTLIGYFNSVRELGGTVRLLQDDIPKRINRIKNRYKYPKARQLFPNKNIEITSRKNAGEISKLLQQLEAPFNDKHCLDTAIATNMIAVGMDVDRLGLMVVTGQPKQNSEYIQATSRIGRKYPGLVITIYNPYRPRDLSHYENFVGYHSQIYRFVEGTTATPFSARARDRVLAALIIAAVRLLYPNFSENDGAAKINSLTSEELEKIEKIILERLIIVNPSAQRETIHEIETFIEQWKQRARIDKNLKYYVFDTSKYGRLMQYYGQPTQINEKPVLNSMREVEAGASMYYWEED